MNTDTETRLVTSLGYRSVTVRWLLIVMG